MQRCDCALFDEVTFSFVEMKMNADADDEGLSARAVRVKAASQIISTINFFQNAFQTQGIVFDHPNIEAIIAVPAKFPKTNATEKQFVEQFATNNGLPLFITPEILFN